MRSKQVTTGVAIAGVLAGATGLALVTVPAGAASNPSLPKTTPEALVNSVLHAKPAAFGGTVSATDNLGVPLPGAEPGNDGDYTAQVYSDGAGKYRATTDADGGGKKTVIEAGDTRWVYDSTHHKAVKSTAPANASQHGARAQNPSTTGRALVDRLRKDSQVSVDGTARVAGRSAYELVLTPKPSEHTLVRQVRMAVDSQTRNPLRFEVFGKGTDPAFEVGFSRIDVGQQDPALFSFTPPAGTKVVTVSPHHDATKHADKQHAKPRVIGSGWDTVVTGKLDQAVGKHLTAAGNKGGKHGHQAGAMLDRYAKPVHGAFGSGRMISTSIGSVLLTNDGRYAAGLVSGQQLEQALGNR